VYDDHHRVLKANPLLDWTRDHVVECVSGGSIPVNSLHDRGFLTIGCASCTRAVGPGEPERAGRWWWEHEDAKECGLHPEYPASLRKRGATLAPLAADLRAGTDRLQHVGAIADGLPSRPAVSQHLKVLKGAGLISNSGRSPDPQPNDEVRHSVDILWPAEDCRVADEAFLRTDSWLTSTRGATPSLL
jgi:hypothetical protein